MGLPAAKMGDKVIGLDVHIVMIPAPPSPPVPTPLPSPFSGTINSGLSSNVNIMGRAAATLGSKAQNIPPHMPTGGPFQRPPLNQGTILKGSATVFINNKPAARMGDTVLTCNDPADLPNGTIVAAGTVFIGG